MDERKIQEIKEEAARQAAVGASGGNEGPALHNEPSDMPKPPVAVEGRTAAQEEGELQPMTSAGVPTAATGPHPGTGPAQGEPAVKAKGTR